MPESTRQLRIRKALEAAGCWVIKTHGSIFGNKGAPDLVGVWEGRGFGFEVKEPGEKLEPMQALHLERIRAAGGVGERVETIEEALAALEGRT